MTSEQIIVATDAGREGELIFRYLYHYTGCTTSFRAPVDQLAHRQGYPRGTAQPRRRQQVRQPLPRRQSAERIRLARGHQRHAGVIHRRRTRHVFQSGGCRHPRWRWCVNATGRTAVSRPKPFWQLHIATDGCDGEVVKFSSSEKWKEKEPAMELYNKVKAAGCATVTKAERKEKTEETPAPVRPDHAPERSQRQARLHGGTDA